MGEHEDLDSFLKKIDDIGQLTLSYIYFYF